MWNERVEHWLGSSPGEGLEGVVGIIHGYCRDWAKLLGLQYLQGHGIELLSPLPVDQSL